MLSLQEINLFFLTQPQWYIVLQYNMVWDLRNVMISSPIVSLNSIVHKTYTHNTRTVPLCTHSYKVVREQTSSAFELSFPPASIILLDIGDYVTYSDRQLIIMLSFVVEFHDRLH